MKPQLQAIHKVASHYEVVRLDGGWERGQKKTCCGKWLTDPTVFDVDHSFGEVRWNCKACGEAYALELLANVP